MFSNCNAESSDCQCRAWTCRCYACWLMRRTYKKVQKQGRMVGAVGEGSTGYFKMVDDSSDDERFKARLLTACNGKFAEEMVQELTRD